MFGMSLPEIYRQVHPLTVLLLYLIPEESSNKTLKYFTKSQPFKIMQDVSLLVKNKAYTKMSSFSIIWFRPSSRL